MLVNAAQHHPQQDISTPLCLSAQSHAKHGADASTHDFGADGRDLARLSSLLLDSRLSQWRLPSVATWERQPPSQMNRLVTMHASELEGWKLLF